MLALIRVRAFPRVVKILQSAYSLQAQQQLEREESNQYRPYTALMTVFFLLNVSFLAYKINGAFQFVMPETAHLLQYLFFACVLLVVFGIHRLANGLLILVTGEARLLSDYQGSSGMLNQAAGLFIFPWIVLAQFSPFNPLVFLSGALITLAASVAISWYRGLLISLNSGHVGLLQIFSYFCALEILPVTVLVKFIIETF